jgi:hypothetical protein
MYINDLKQQLNWQDLHFANFLKKYYSKTHIESLSKKEASNLIVSLKNILKHERTKRGRDAQSE